MKDINNILAKKWNGKVYDGFVYLDGQKTKVNESIKSDIVDWILSEGIIEANNTFRKQLTIEQVAKIEAMKSTLMKNSLETVMLPRFQNTMIIKCSNYIKNNF